jgi:hypothetical protein
VVSKKAISEIPNVLRRLAELEASKEVSVRACQFSPGPRVQNPVTMNICTTDHAVWKTRVHRVGRLGTRQSAKWTSF